MRAAIRYQHVIDGQDGDIVRDLEGFGTAPEEATSDHHDPIVTTRFL